MGKPILAVLSVSAGAGHVLEKVCQAAPALTAASASATAGSAGI